MSFQNVVTTNIDLVTINHQPYPPTTDAINIVQKDSTAGTFYPVFSSALNQITDTLGSSSKITYTPETGVLGASTISGTTGLTLNNTTSPGNAIIMNNISGMIIETGGTGAAGNIVILTQNGNSIGLFSGILNVGDDTQTIQYSLPTSPPSGSGYVLQSTSGGAGASVSWQALPTPVSVFRVTINNMQYNDNQTSSSVSGTFDITLAITGNQCILSIPAVTTTTNLSSNLSYLIMSPYPIPSQYLPYICTDTGNSFYAPILIQAVGTNQTQGQATLYIDQSSGVMSIRGFSAILGNSQTTGLNLTGQTVFIPGQSIAWDIVPSMTMEEKINMTPATAIKKLKK